MTTDICYNLRIYKMDYERPVHIHNNYKFSPSVHRIPAIDKSLIEDKLLIQKLELVRERKKKKL